jgi:hypothetical protein
MKYIFLICLLILQIYYIQSSSSCDWNTALTNVTCQGCVDIPGCAYCSVSNGVVQGYNASTVCIDPTSSLCISTEESSSTSYYSGLCSITDFLNVLFYLWVSLVGILFCCCIGGIYLCIYGMAGCCGFGKKTVHISEPIYGKMFYFSTLLLSLSNKLFIIILYIYFIIFISSFISATNNSRTTTGISKPSKTV